MNLLSKELKALYIHLPKNGGHTIWQLLLNGSDSWKKARMPIGKMKLSQLNELYIFTIVRNPYDRYLSGWKNLTPNKQNITPEYFQQNYKLPKTNISNIHLYWSQTHHLRNVLNHIDDIFRFEEFNATYKNINDKFNCGGIYPPVHGTKSTQGLKSKKETVTLDFLNDEIINYINETFHEDFENFGYQKL